MSKRFVIEAGKAWKYLWTYPIIRKFMKEVWDKQDKSQYIGLYEIKQGFDSQYKWAMQSQYTTNLPNLSQYIKNGCKVLEVGCGDGKRVKAMQEQDIDAIGIEINEAWLQPGIVEKGDALQLDYPDNSFDIVLSVDLLEHLDDPLKAVAEMFRVSRDKVIVSLTPVEDRTFWEDPTHKMEWDTGHWMRELNEFGEIIEKLPPTTFVMKKRK